ncbi:MAG: winged helix DNA-binding domain-containing protein [Clostridiales bacterium]|nr:winged helix DNA-binding domain-containing protein [Clostridiales bacterium]
MSNEIRDETWAIRNLILSSQYLDKRSTKNVEDIVSDICGLQYDPNPTIHLNQYMMLWNRKKDFVTEELDVAAYKEFKIIEAFAFKRNMFFVPYHEFAIYRAATKGIIRWGSSDESWLMAANSASDQAAENELKKGLQGLPGMTTKQIWASLHLSDEWDAYVKGRREGNLSFELPIFRAFYRLKRKTELVTCGRNAGTFKEPLYILKENIGIDEWPNAGMSENDARTYIIEKLIASFGITYPVHISHITGIPTAQVLPIFSQLEQENRISPFKIGKKVYYIHSSKTNFLDKCNRCAAQDSEEIRFISPMDTLVRDQKWLKTFFDYSFTFEYFKKKGMKWPLSILVGNRFIGYLDCKMEWRTQNFIIKEKNIFDSDFTDHKALQLAIEDLAAFHGAKKIVEKRQ